MFLVITIFLDFVFWFLDGELISQQSVIPVIWWKYCLNTINRVCVWHLTNLSFTWTRLIHPSSRNIMNVCFWLAPPDHPGFQIECLDVILSMSLLPAPCKITIICLPFTVFFFFSQFQFNFLLEDNQNLLQLFLYFWLWLGTLLNFHKKGIFFKLLNFLCIVPLIT